MLKNKYLSQQISKKFKNKHRKNTHRRNWCIKCQTKNGKYGAKKGLRRKTIGINDRHHELGKLRRLKEVEYYLDHEEYVIKHSSSSFGRIHRMRELKELHLELEAVTAADQELAELNELHQELKYDDDLYNDEARYDDDYWYYHDLYGANYWYYLSYSSWCMNDCWYSECRTSIATENSDNRECSHEQEQELIVDHLYDFEPKYDWKSIESQQKNKCLSHQIAKKYKINTEKIQNQSLIENGINTTKNGVKNAKERTVNQGQRMN